MSYINVLMVDDQKANYDALKNKAANREIILKYAESLDEMLEVLKANLDIDAVILDGKGFIKKGQIKGTEKEDFVHEALTQIAFLEREQDRFIPKCVYTAWYDELKNSLESRIRVFDKISLSNDKGLMEEFFDYLHKEVASSLNNKVKIKYEAVLNGFGDNYLPVKYKGLLLKLLNLLENNGYPEKGDFTALRDILEEVFKRGAKPDIGLIPIELFNSSNKPNLKWCCLYLAGKNVKTTKDPNGNDIYVQIANNDVPPHISYAIDFVKETSSALSHPYPASWTPFSFKSAALALAEIIIWFKNYIDSKYPTI